MARKYFGTDGVRGTIGSAPMTPDFVLRLGYAVGRMLTQHGLSAQDGRPAVLIGKDTRISGYMIEAALEAGFSAAGVDVLLCGPLPTPAVAYLTRALRLSGGVVISASHNPYPDNGIKFFSGDGYKLPDDVELEIESKLEEPIGCNASVDLGRARRVDDAAGRYIEFCKSTFPIELDLRGMKIVVDCANGAAYSVAPHVFHELGAEVVAIGAEPDGFNINDKVGATSPQTLAEAVRRHGATLGIALDGDADRVVIADGEGTLYDGDQLLYAIVKRIAARGTVSGVAGTLMTNLALEQAFARMQIPFERANVGDRYVLELLRRRGWYFGGENSGHILCLDRHTTGDGIVSALQALASIRESGQELGNYVGDLKLFPQVLLNVKVGRDFDWKANPAVRQVCAEVERSLGTSGRVLLRASGTEPVVRVMVEGEQAPAIEAAARHIAEAVEAAAGA